MLRVRFILRELFLLLNIDSVLILLKVSEFIGSYISTYLSIYLSPESLENYIDSSPEL